MKTKKSFTVIELLVVIAIIGLISSIILVSLKEAREKARIAKALEFSHSIQHTLGAYAVGIWKFEEAGDTALDSSGYGNNGQLGDGTCTPCSGSCPCWTGDGILGSALSFDGVDDYVDCGSDKSLEITGDITIEAWVKPDIPKETGRIYQRYWWDNAGVRFDLSVWSDTKVIVFYTFQSGIYQQTYAWDAPFSYGVWNHIVVVRKGPTATIYVNGQDVTTFYGTHIDPALGPEWVHAHISADWAPEVFSGLIDEVRIYSQALSEAEIQKHYAEGLNKHKLVEK